MTCRSKELKKGIIGIAIAATLAAGCGQAPEPEAKAASTIIVPAQTLTVGKSATDGSYTAHGVVAPELRATLGSKVMGRITQVLVREGDSVRKGQTLVIIDARELEAAMKTASANHQAASVGVSSARTAADMEARTSQARIEQAEAMVKQAEASAAAAQARLDLALAGPRNQELTQARIAVTQAESSLKLAEVELNRTRTLVEEGAKARRELDLSQNRYDLAKGQYEAALQAENMAKEGSRSQDIRAAEEAVTQAKAALRQARAGVTQAKAAALQVQVRKKEIEMARAQERQASAAIDSAQVNLSYTRIVAPFDGRITQRLVDPGTMATPGSPLITIEGGQYRLEASVPESVLTTLRIGDRSPITVDALSTKAFDGKIAEIVPSGTAGTHSFTVKYALPPSASLKSGMFGRVRIRTDESDRIIIPKDSTWEKEGLNYLFTVNQEGIARLRFVTLGEPTDGRVEVLSGLNDGDRIVVGDRSRVVDGAKIEEAGQ